MVVVPTWIIAALITLVASIAGRLSPALGVRVLPGLGVISAAGILYGLHMSLHPFASAPIWPTVVGGIVFFYVWWLAAILFDLSFIWQWFVRHSALRAHLADRCVNEQEPNDSTGKGAGDLVAQQHA